MARGATRACFGTVPLLLGTLAYDLGEDITLCWVTNLSRPDEGPRKEDCRGARVDVAGFPEEMWSDESYAMSFTMVVPLELQPQDDVPHFNVHSCPRKIGFCTPFVKESPELATHSPALTGSLPRATGLASFDNDVRLPSGQYTIIGHGRWFDAAGLKHDMARARVRDVLEPPPPTPVFFYIAVALGILVAVLFVLGLILAAWYMARLVRANEAWKVRLKSEARERLSCAIEGVQEFRYPFCVTKVSSFELFGRLKSHEECRDAGHLTVLDTWDEACDFAWEYRAFFVSHQWLGFAQPDPNNVHYPVIVRAAKDILQHSDASPRNHMPAGSWEDRIYIWVDYMSMPQRCPASLSNAVSSLSAYVPVCKWFLICAPPTVHVDKNVQVDGETYLRRGWCRFEQWARLSTGGLNDMYVCRGEKVEHLSDPIFEPWVRESINVFQGEYNNAGDMKELVNLTLGLWGYTLLGLASKKMDRIRQEVESDRQRVFPKEHFGELVELLEVDIANSNSELNKNINFVRFRDSVNSLIESQSTSKFNTGARNAAVEAIRNMSAQAARSVSLGTSPRSATSPSAAGPRGEAEVARSSSADS